MEVSENKSGEIKEELIPGLPEDLAWECLIRVPFEFHSSMKYVSRSWNRVISSRDFNKERRRCGKAESLLCFVQNLPSPSNALSEQRFGLTVYNSTLETWHRIMIPERSIPFFCKCVVIQEAGKVLLIGGYDITTMLPVRDVFVFDFFAAEGSGRRWRRGKPMSAVRTLFACASVGSSKVYVAGGRDAQYKALRSAEVYDVEKDEWTILPPMAEERNNCDGFSMATDLGFCVLSGLGIENEDHQYQSDDENEDQYQSDGENEDQYQSDGENEDQYQSDGENEDQYQSDDENEDQYRSDGEIYDPISNSWSTIKNVWPFSDITPRARITAAATESSAGDFTDCKFWCFISSERQSEPRWKAEDDLMKWKIVMDTFYLPVSVTEKKLVLVGSLSGKAVAMIHGDDEKYGTMTIEMTSKGEKWSQLNVPSAFRNFAKSNPTSIYV